MTREELISILNLTFFDQKFPPPKYGNGENVIELDGTHSWECLNAALEDLNDTDLFNVLRCDLSFNFHNNASNGHYSVGADWTIQQFAQSNGSWNLKDRIKLIESKL